MPGLWIVLGLIGLAVIAPAVGYLRWLAAAVQSDPPRAGRTPEVGADGRDCRPAARP